MKRSALSKIAIFVLITIVVASCGIESQRKELSELNESSEFKEHKCEHDTIAYYYQGENGIDSFMYHQPLKTVEAPVEEWSESNQMDPHMMIWIKWGENTSLTSVTSSLPIH